MKDINSFPQKMGGMPPNVKGSIPFLLPLKPERKETTFGILGGAPSIEPT